MFTATLQATTANFSVNQSNTPDEVIIIPLDKQKINAEKFPYYVDEVVVLQNEKHILGFVSEGHVPFQFQTDIETELNTFFKKQFPNGTDKKPISVRLNRLSVAVYENQMRVGLSLSFFERNNNKYILLYNAAHVQTSNISMLEKLPNKVALVITLGFQKCVLELHERHQKETLFKREIEERELGRIKIDTINFPIIGNQIQKPGVYYNYNDFLENHIDTTAKFRMFQLMPSDTLVKKAKFQNRKRKDIWALWDGEHYYINIKNNYHRVKYNHQKNFFEVCFRTKDFNNVGSDVITVFYFGLVGLAIKKIIENETSKDLVLPMDIVTGTIYFQPRLEKEVIIECVGKEENVEVTLQNETGTICKLNQGEYFRYKSNSLDGIVRITLKSVNHEREIVFDPMNIQRVLIEHKPQKIAVEFPPFVNPSSLETHLKKRRNEIKHVSIP